MKRASRIRRVDNIKPRKTFKQNGIHSVCAFKTLPLLLQFTAHDSELFFPFPFQAKTSVWRQILLFIKLITMNMFRFLKRSFAEHAFSLFSVFLSSKLCFFVSSYNVDPSCLDYKGQNIHGEIYQAIDKAFDLAIMGFAQAHIGHSNTNHLKSALFGSDQARYVQAAGFLGSVPDLLYNLDFKVICDDLIVKLETSPNGQVEWVDDDHRWSGNLASFNPCDPIRKLNNPSTVRMEVYTLFGRLIYVCPVILDYFKGRLLRLYKNLDLLGSFFEDYVVLPVTLLHELLHLSPAEREFLYRSRSHDVRLTQNI